MQMRPLSRSHLSGTATSVKHEEVLKFETPIVESAWTLPQCFRTWLAFFFTSQYNCCFTAISLPLSTVQLHPTPASKGFSHQPIPLILGGNGGMIFVLLGFNFGAEGILLNMSCH